MKDPGWSDLVKAATELTVHWARQRPVVRRRAARKELNANCEAYLRSVVASCATSANPFDYAAGTRVEKLLPRVTVPLSLFAPERAMPDSGLKSQRLPVTVSSEEALRHTKRLCIIGLPGTGKTTLLKSIALSLAEHKWDFRTSSGDRSTQAVPVLVHLPDFAGCIEQGMDANRFSAGENLLTVLLGVHLARSGLLPDSGHLGLNNTLTAGRYVFLLDSFDEIPSSYTKTIAYLARFCEDVGDNWVVISSRPEGLTYLPELGGAEGLSELWVSPLSPQLQWAFLDKRLGDAAANVWRSVRRLPGELRANPLFLSMVAGLHSRNKLPSDWQLDTLYRLSLAILLGKWTSGRLTSSAAEATTQRTVARLSLFEAMSACALEATDGFVTHETRRLLLERYWRRDWTDDDLELVQQQSPIFYGPPEERKPLHRSFLEYGFARHLAEDNRSRDKRIIQHLELNPASRAGHFCAKMVKGEALSKFLRSVRTWSTNNVTAPREAMLTYGEIAMEADLPPGQREAVIAALEELCESDPSFHSPVSLATRAARILGHDIKYVEACCEKLEASDDDARKQQMDWLSAMQSLYALPYLRKWVSHQDNYVRFYAVEALGQMADLEAIGRFEQQWRREEDWDIKAAMVEAATIIPTRDAVRVFSLASSDPAVKEVVKWEAEVAERLREENMLINRLRAAEALGRLDAALKETRPTLQAWILGGTYSNRVEATTVILGFHAQLREHAGIIHEALRSVALDPKAAWLLARTMRGLADPQMEPMLRSGLRTLQGRVFTFARGELARGLGAVRARSAISDLCSAYGRANDQYERLWIWIAVFQIGLAGLSEEHIDEVASWAKEALAIDTYHRVRHYAKLCLRRIEGRTGTAGHGQG